MTPRTLAARWWPRVTKTLVVCWVTGVFLLAFAWRLALGQSATRMHQPLEWQWDLHARYPRPPVPAANPMTVAKVELGRHLFYDPRLSGNETQSCATCHKQELAFTDGRGRAIGSTGEVHPRGSMSLVNVAFQPLLTWAHPGIEQLEDQALVPLLGEEPVEMGMAGREVELMERLAADATYQRLFAVAFPGEPMSLHQVTRALAAFQRSITSFRSPYDRYRYLREEDAISDQAKRGMVIFFSSAKGGCFQCHGGLLFNGAVQTDAGEPATPEFHNTGLYNLTAPPGAYPAPNTGLHAHSGRLEDMGAFRVPTLRNIAVTAPYMHDGSIATLSGVISHYETGGRAAGPYTSHILRTFQLTSEERADLIAFLDSLTDDEALRDPRWRNPWNRPLPSSPALQPD